MPRLVVGWTVLDCSPGPAMLPMLGKLGKSGSPKLVGFVTVTLLSLGLTVGRKSFKLLSVVVFSLKSSLLTLSLLNLTGTELSGTEGLGDAGEGEEDPLCSNVEKNPSIDVGLFFRGSSGSESVRSLNLNLNSSLENAFFSSAPVFVF